MEHASQPRDTRFGPYSVVREIGRGAMATVYEAVHRELGKRVAIKVLSDAMRSAPNGTARFFREARIVGQLRHPHIVDAIDIGEIEGRPYLVMELLEGGDLESYLGRHGILSPADTADLLLPVASAVAAAHESGVVHRDLKPSNILVARRGGRVHPVVVDFGVSKRDDDDAGSQLTHPETLVGTIAYMAPEQVRGARHASRMSDQYAIGVILYRCLTGRLPFEGAGEYETMASIVNAPLVPPSQLNPAVPPALDAITLRAMHRQASKRYPSVVALGSDLLALASAEALTLWSGEMASDAQAQAIARAAGGTRVELAPPPTRVTHVTEVLPVVERRRWHYRMLAGALAFAVLAAGVSRIPGALPATASAARVTAKQAPSKARTAGADALVTASQPPLAPSAEKPRGTNASLSPSTAPASTALVPVKARFASGVRPATSEPRTITGPNGAPILE